MIITAAFFGGSAYYIAGKTMTVAFRAKAAAEPAAEAEKEIPQTPPAQKPRKKTNPPAARKPQPAVRPLKSELQRENLDFEKELYGGGTEKSQAILCPETDYAYSDASAYCEKRYFKDGKSSVLFFSSDDILTARSDYGASALAETSAAYYADGKPRAHGVYDKSGNLLYIASFDESGDASSVVLYGMPKGGGTIQYYRPDHTLKKAEIKSADGKTTAEILFFDALHPRGEESAPRAGSAAKHGSYLIKSGGIITDAINDEQRGQWKFNETDDIVVDEMTFMPYEKLKKPIDYCEKYKNGCKVRLKNKMEIL